MGRSDTAVYTDISHDADAYLQFKDIRYCDDDDGPICLFEDSPSIYQLN